MTVHIVWNTKYSYSVLTGDVQKRCRILFIEVRGVEGVQILKDVVRKDHVHMHLEYRSSPDVSAWVKKWKGKRWWKLQQEFPKLKIKYWGRHFWAIGYVVEVLVTSRSR